MARRGVPKGPVNWYLNEWMAALGITKQTELMEMTEWSKATASQLCSGKQDYSPGIINTAARAFGVEPYELLIHPDRAMAIRRMYADARQFVETAAEADVPKEIIDLNQQRARRAG